MMQVDDKIEEIEPIKLNFDNIDESKDDNEIDPEVHVEEEARNMGWKPLEEWEGPKHKWRSAKEFVDRDSFFKKIENQNRVIKELQESLKVLGSHQAKLAKVEREKVLRELKAQKKEAFENQDFEALEAVDAQIMAVETAPEPEIKVPDTSTVEDNNRLFDDFKRRNEWYEQDPELRDLADTLATGYAYKAKLENKDVKASELFDYIEKQVAKQRNIPAKRAPDPVSGTRSTTSSAANTQGKKSKFTQADLSSEQLRFAKRFVESGAFKNVQEYVDSLAATGDLG